MPFGLAAPDSSASQIRADDRAAGPPAPSVARCMLAIALVKGALRTVGLGRTIRWIRRRVTGIEVREVSPACVARWEYAVAMAAAVYPGRAHCLERSLVLFYLARRSGIAVTYHHGVRPLPFAAHAWVEFEGRVVNDVFEHILLYQRFPQVCP